MVNKVVSIHQPHYFPYPGFFDKVVRSDVFIILDNVQYVKNEWINRNRVLSCQGVHYITIPVHYRFPLRIDEVEIVNRSDWRRKHVNMIRSCYGRAPFFKEFFEQVCECVELDGSGLARYLIGHTLKLFQLLGIDTGKVVVASQLGIRENDPTMRLIKLCREVEGDTYLSGDGGRNYLERELFDREGIELRFQDYEPIRYKQFNAPGFVQDLSVLDMLFNCGRLLRVVEGEV